MDVAGAGEPSNYHHSMRINCQHSFLTTFFKFSVEPIRHMFQNSIRDFAKLVFNWFPQLLRPGSLVLSQCWRCVEANGANFEGMKAEKAIFMEMQANNARFVAMEAMASGFKHMRALALAKDEADNFVSEESVSFQQSSSIFVTNWQSL